MNVYRNTATIVRYSHTIVRKECDLNIVCKTTHSFVPSVIKNLCYEMLEAIKSSSTNVHSGTLSNRFQALQYGDLFSSIATCFLCLFVFFYLCHELPVYQKYLFKTSLN